MTVEMSAWNLPANTGFLFSIFLKTPSVSQWLTLNGSGPSKATKMMPKIPNGLEIYLGLDLFPDSFIPPKPIRILREYTRYISKLTSCKVSEKNRFQNAFTVCNVSLDAVVSDMFGKSASSITDYLITTNEFSPETCTSLLQKSLKKKAESVLESIEGYHITQEQKVRMLSIRSHLDFVEGKISFLKSQLEVMVAPFGNVIRSHLHHSRS